MSPMGWTWVLRAGEVGCIVGLVDHIFYVHILVDGLVIYVRFCRLLDAFVENFMFVNAEVYITPTYRLVAVIPRACFSLSSHTRVYLQTPAPSIPS